MEGIERVRLEKPIKRSICGDEVLCYDFENARRLALFVAALIDYMEAVEASCREETP